MRGLLESAVYKHRYCQEDTEYVSTYSVLIMGLQHSMPRGMLINKTPSRNTYFFFCSVRQIYRKELNGSLRRVTMNDQKIISLPAEITMKMDDVGRGHLVEAEGKECYSGSHGIWPSHGHS